ITELETTEEDVRFVQHQVIRIAAENVQPFKRMKMNRNVVYRVSVQRWKKSIKQAIPHGTITAC
ncbi:unnamed protein product, partial [Didymodactylos carnosus]